ncbi:bifunctional metallophosphatase/5'-nucleotidase [Synechocystis sp. PCC 7339]|uniref:bifunctional metallophosphatase/5'-nucleotidase n=1 Tax=unclassified Synechocystis TaxID=2640012 RepID=UPI001BAEE9AB|nr:MULTISPECIES: bifunctional metallophosphatase/5'-nucleotidase [unclassified Synechocystis]QUS62149.1 bifunctional metallophosphatase/5'-nucleotidase [Synechocystis sp. PCC 7338]UAJ71332.1 bifunctional metallophosphatase/5'-nucleotidase [Synechocystis sp. PCC 7339]
MIKNQRIWLTRALGGLVIWGAMATACRAETIPFTLLQLNDVYEIAPIDNGRWGGLARVANLRRQLEQANPHTYTVLAGDFLSPSALGTALYNGDRLAGKQMVAVLNAMGLDYAAVGNHEFDVTAQQFMQRIAESDFQWLSANIADGAGNQFTGIKPYEILTIPGVEGGELKVGILALTIDSNAVHYVTYSEPIATARHYIKSLEGEVDVWVALTHLSLAQDLALAQAIPELDLILGGHEHENIQRNHLIIKPDSSPSCPQAQTPIFKADANARTVYIHQLTYDTDRQCLEIDSQLQPITAEIASDPATEKVVEQWQEIGFNAFRQQGFEPMAVVVEAPMALDALDAHVRSRSTNLTRLITRAMEYEYPEAAMVMFNGGMVRLDDLLSAGAITQYDIIRLLPFGGRVVTVDIQGDLLQKILAQGEKNSGTGGYLQLAGLAPNSIEPSKTYRVALMEYLLTGQEVGLDYLTANTPGLKVINYGRDIRSILVDYLQNNAQQAFADLGEP